MNPSVVLIHGMWSTGTTLEPIRKAFESWGFSCHSPRCPFMKTAGMPRKSPNSRTPITSIFSRITSKV
jgi:hypothetical protein